MTLLTFIRTAVGALMIFIAAGCERGPVDLSPVSWPEGELDKFRAIDNGLGRETNRLVEGQGPMVTVTSSAIAARAGMEALRQNGTAMDAALTAALTQIALAAESWVSYAGFLILVYYDAATGETHTLNAGFNTVLGEDDPLTIPFMGTPSGRAAVVPGFMAGVESAHARFGRLPFASLFTPAIHFADQGVVLTEDMAQAMKKRADVLTRFPEGRDIFTKTSSALYEAGDLFRQPAMAETLRNVALEGAGYMYQGAWAHKMVEMVRREGGKMTLDDLARYKPIWSAPARTTFRGFEVFAPPPPNYGGVSALEVLNVLEAAQFLDPDVHYTSRAEELYWMAQILRLSELISDRRYGPADLPQRFLGPMDLSAESRLKKETSAALWQQMQTEAWPQLKQAAFDESKQVLEKWQSYMRTRPSHSDGVVVVDKAGNVAALVHTINTLLWGMGLFVDGITLPDIGALQQDLIRQVGVGKRLPDPTTPLVVTRNGAPVLGAASIGYGVHVANAQSLVNVLAYGMDPQAAISQPQLLRTYWRHRPEDDVQPVLEGAFSDQVLGGMRALGQPTQEVPRDQVGDLRGHWIGIRLDPASKTLQGGVTNFSKGFVLQ